MTLQAAMVQSVKNSEASSDDWCTPADILTAAADCYPVGLDPCAGPPGWVCARRTIEFDQDGLKSDWWLDESCVGNCIWVNPPFSQISRWVDKAVKVSRDGFPMFFLGASRTSARWYGKLWDNSDVAILLRKRPRFVDPVKLQPMGSAPFDVTVFGLNVSPRRVRAAFNSIARVVVL